MDAELEALRQENQKLRQQLEALNKVPKREKISAMSSEVVDSNPYRLSFS